MKVCVRELYPYPGYEDHVKMNIQTDEGGKVSTEELQAQIKAYKLGEGTTMRDFEIPGVEEGTTLKLRVITPANAPKPSPVVLDIHGGGFVSGNLDIDNYRNIAIAEATPCIVVSVEYRLATRELPVPAQLMDCHQAYLWLTQHAAEIGGDASRIALHGTSAGGNLAAALALYLRDHGEQQPALTVLVNPILGVGLTASQLQMGYLGAKTDYAHNVFAIYANMNGEAVSYYAAPLLCPTLEGLGPHMIVAAEYDPLRDEALQYAMRLLQEQVPCEVYSAPRVTHGFCVLDKPLTRWVHRGIAASLRREFGMEITEI